MRDELINLIVGLWTASKRFGCNVELFEMLADQLLPLNRLGSLVLVFTIYDHIGLHEQILVHHPENDVRLRSLPVEADLVIGSVFSLWQCGSHS